MTRELKAWLPWLTIAAIGLVQACATSKPASKPERQDCTREAAAEIAAACFLRVKTECVEKGIPQEECPAIKECDAAADKRAEECRR
jgi:hypothetical protein